MNDLGSDLLPLEANAFTDVLLYVCIYIYIWNLLNIVFSNLCFIKFPPLEENFRRHRMKLLLRNRPSLVNTFIFVLVCYTLDDGFNYQGDVN